MPRLSKTTREISKSQTQNVSDSSIPSPGVPVVSRKTLESDRGVWGEDDDVDALGDKGGLSRGRSRGEGHRGGRPEFPRCRG